MHQLGFWHEHERPDRDDHIEINWLDSQPGLKRGKCPIGLCKDYNLTQYGKVLNCIGIHKCMHNLFERSYNFIQIPGPGTLDLRSLNDLEKMLARSCIMAVMIFMHTIRRPTKKLKSIRNCRLWILIS